MRITVAAAVALACAACANPARMIHLETEPPGATAKLEYPPRPGSYCPAEVVTPASFNLRSDVACRASITKPGYVAAEAMIPTSVTSQTIRVRLEMETRSYLANDSNGFARCSEQYLRDFGKDSTECRKQARLLTSEGSDGKDGKEYGYAVDEAMWESCMLAEGWIPVAYMMDAENQPCFTAKPTGATRGP